MPGSLHLQGRRRAAVGVEDQTGVDHGGYGDQTAGEEKEHVSNQPFRVFVTPVVTSVTAVAREIGCCKQAYLE